MSNGKYDQATQRMAALAQEAADELEADGHIGPAATVTAGASATGALLRVASELARIVDALEGANAARERAANPARFVTGVSEVAER